jgi:phage tail-like protein
VQVVFDPQDSSGLSPAFRNKPVAEGVLAVFAGGWRAERFFAAWLMAGELGLPLVQAAVAVPGCVSFVAGPPAGAIQAPPGSVVVLSQDGAPPATGLSADLVVQFPAAASPNAPPATPSATPANRIDPCCNFDVVIGGVSYGFSEAGPLVSAAQNSWGTTYPNIVLRRAITLNKDLYAWRMNIVNGQADVRTVAVNHLSAAGDIVRTWWIEGAWPVRWTGPSFDSMASRPAMEEIEIRISRFEWI